MCIDSSIRIRNLKLFTYNILRIIRIWILTEWFKHPLFIIDELHLNFLDNVFYEQKGIPFLLYLLLVKKLLRQQKFQSEKQER